MPLIAYYNFNDPSAVVDSIGGDQNGSYQGNATANGGNLVLDGNGDYALIPPDTAFQLSKGTLVTEFSPDALQNGTIFSRDSSGFDDGGHVTLKVLSNGRVNLRHQTDSASEVFRTPTGFYSAGDDIRVTHSWNDDGSGGAFRVENLTAGTSYTDSVPATLSWDMGPNFNEPITIGADQGRSGDNTANRLRDFFDGDVAYVAIYDDVVTNAVPCFAKGTLIRTDRGEVLVEDLRDDDLIITVDQGAQPIVWRGKTVLCQDDLDLLPNMRPIRIKARKLANDKALVVSPQHCVVVETPEGQVFVRAKHLAEFSTFAHVALGRKSVTYFHIVLPQHAVIFANGAATESFYPGPQALRMLSDQDLGSLRSALGAMENGTDLAYGPTALPVLKRREAATVILAQSIGAKNQAIAAAE